MTTEQRFDALEKRVTRLERATHRKGIKGVNRSESFIKACKSLTKEQQGVSSSLISLEENQELTPKDLFCIAKHMQIYIKVLHHEEEGWQPFDCCHTCRQLGEECKHPGEFWDTMRRLTGNTGVNISALYNFKL